MENDERPGGMPYIDPNEPRRHVPRPGPAAGIGVIETPAAPPPLPEADLGDAVAPVAESAPAETPARPHTTVDPLQVIAANEDNPDAVRILAMRLGRAERQIPQVMQLTQNVTNLLANQEQLQKVVGTLSSHQAMAELQMERHVRGMALDLALKAAKGKDDSVVDADLVTGLAEGFLVWLKGGTRG